MTSSNISQRVRWLLNQLLIVATYFCLARISLIFAFEHENISPVWFPTGFALVILLKGGYQFAIAILLGATVATFSVSGSFDFEHIASALGIGLGNTLEAVIGCYLIRKTCQGEPNLEQVSDMLKFLMYGVVGCTVISATVGVSSLCATGLASWEQFNSLWIVWWIGDSAGALLVAPVLLTWTNISRFEISLKQSIEFLLLMVFTILVSLFVFGRGSVETIENHPQAVLVIPVYIWSIFRFRLRGFSVIHLLVCGIAIWGTVRGTGPFVRNDIFDSLLVLMGNIAVAGATMFLMAALVEERRKSDDERIELQENLARASRLSLMGEMAAGIAHELNQPLGAIVNYASGCLRRLESGKMDDDELKEALEEMKSGSFRAKETITRIRAFIQKHETKKTFTDVNEIIDDAITLLNLDRAKKNVPIEFNPGVALPKVFADPVQISQVIINLLTNSLQSIEDLQEKGWIKIGTKLHENKEVLVGVEDNGCGMDPSMVENSFGQFFTTKPNGIGMGLAISNSIIQAHFGTISLESNPGIGTYIWFTLPTERAEVQS